MTLPNARRLALLAALLGLAPLATGGCAIGILAAGATAGAIAGSEIEEGDGRFDPLERTEVGRQIYD